MCHLIQATLQSVISPRLLHPLFSSHLVLSKYNIPLSIRHKVKQARFKIKYNIPLSISHKSKQARFKYKIPRYKIGS